MDNIFADYILYYEARVKRLANNEHYINSYQAEKALYELVKTCNSVEELQTKASEFTLLSTQNAIALIKDQEIYRKQVYEDCKETIRVQAPANILAAIDELQNDMEIVNVVNKVHQQNSIDVTVDELVNMFYSDFVAMENIEVYRDAEIPEEWKTQCGEYAKDILESGKKIYHEVELPNARQWKAGWELDYNLLKEERHRRLIPINDDELEKKITLHKTYKPA